MSAATKVTIAVAVVFAAILGIYYSFSGPQTDGLATHHAQPPAGAPLPRTDPVASEIQGAVSDPAAEARSTGFPSSETRSTGFPSSETRSTGFPSSETRSSGFPSSETRSTGFPSSETGHRRRAQ